MANDFNAINFEYLLIEHYKDLNIKEEELAVILVVNHLLKQHNDIITAEDLSFKMNLDSKRIDDILSNLVTKNIVDLVFDKKGGKLSLSPLKNKLFQQFKLDIYKEEERQNEIARKKNEALINIRAIMANANINPNDLKSLLDSEAQVSTQKRNVPPKYRFTTKDGQIQTWTGQGRTPTEFLNCIKREGNPMEYYLIKEN